MTYVWRNLFQRKVRTALSMLGVSVAVAGIVALISVARGMRTSLDDYMTNTGASLVVHRKNVADLVFSTVSKKEIEELRRVPGVQDVSRANFSLEQLPKTGGRKPLLPVVLCFGRFPEDRIMNMYRAGLADGKLFQTKDEIIVSRYLAETLDWGVGTTVKLFGQTFTVVGTYTSRIAWENQGLVLHGDVVSKQLGRDGYTVAFVYTADKDRDAVQKRIRTAFPRLDAVPPGLITAQFEDQFAVLDEMIQLVTIIALIIGVLGVLNTMMMSVSERTREIGMLRAVGWPRRLVVRAILFEGVLLATIGGLIGLGLGYAGTELLLYFHPTSLVATYETATFVSGFTVGLCVGVLAAIYPAFRAANLKPVEALRYE